MTATPESRQLALETDAVAAAVERLNKRREEARLDHTRAGATILRTLVDPLTHAIAEAQKAVSEGRDTSSEGMAFLSLPPDVLAVITLKAIVGAVTLRTRQRPIRCLGLARGIGAWCALEYLHAKVSRRERELLELWVGRTKNPWDARRRAKEKIQTFRRADWQKKGWEIKVGARLVELAVEATGLLKKPADYKWSITLELTEEALGKIEELLKLEESLVTPQREPMVSRPVPWTSLDDGGYQCRRLPLVKHRNHSHRLALLRRAELTEPKQAITALQETEWRVNKPAFLLLDTAYERGEPREVLKLSQADGEEAGQGASAAVIVQQCLAIGRKFLGEPVLFFPHHIDSRGRAYPFPRLVHPQGDDRGRGLLEFARGKPLGEKGAEELSVHLANLFGEVDKEPRARRIAWVEEHREAIVDSALRPLDGGRFWTRADKPLRFWAAAKELEGFLREGPSFQSHLPIARDGTCNGLQHYSALGLDPIGGSHTNLVPSERMQDIYRVVSEATNRVVEERAAAGEERASEWKGKITRKTVKPATMMTPYSVTRTGIRRQLQELIEAELPGHFPDAGEAAGWLAGVLQQVIRGVVAQAVKIMKWLKEVVQLFAEYDRGVYWTLPTGLVVLQERRVAKERRIRTLAHTLVTWEHDPRGEIQLSEQKNGIAANLVHSLDAAHMMRTVLALKREGITDFAMVHDSYAVHAADIAVMDRVLREEFVRLHQELTLRSLWEEFKRQAPHFLVAPRPPPVGTLDLSLVQGSEYFFS